MVCRASDRAMSRTKRTSRSNSFDQFHDPARCGHVRIDAINRAYATFFRLSTERICEPSAPQLEIWRLQLFLYSPEITGYTREFPIFW